jgi:2-C-methyl-D-erythritol 2,4-cyclodiphosphate synthase
MPGDNVRIGHGFDVHPFKEGRKLVLGGVTIPWEKGLAGHSDADVLVHAVCDALLGAASEGDLGRHFPDDDRKFKDMSSLYFLTEILKILNNKGLQVVNVDSTIIAEEPKLKAFIPAMLENMANALKVPPERVNVKATTTEGLGYTGRGEGIAAHAVVILDTNT